MRGPGLCGGLASLALHAAGVAVVLALSVGDASSPTLVVDLRTPEDPVATVAPARAAARRARVAPAAPGPSLSAPPGGARSTAPLAQGGGPALGAPVAAPAPEPPASPGAGASAEAVAGPGVPGSGAPDPAPRAPPGSPPPVVLVVPGWVDRPGARPAPAPAAEASSAADAARVGTVATRGPGPGRVAASGPAEGAPVAPAGTGRDGTGAPAAPAGAGWGGAGPRGDGGGGRGAGAESAAVEGSEGTDGRAYRAYLEGIRARVQRALRYPEAARRRGLEGVVVLEVEILPSGRVGTARVLATSSHALLDDAALDGVRSVGAAGFPPDLPPRRIRVELPVTFRLE